MEQEIEFVPSPQFERRDAAAKILGRTTASALSSRRAAPAPVDDLIAAPATVAAPPGTPPYLAALYEFPLLTREQEYEQFRRMNFLKYEAEQLRRTIDLRRPRRHVLDQIEQNLADALELRNSIAQSNLRLVVSIAKTLVDPSNSFDDLVSEGNIPLIRAVEIFDFERGTRFSTYATWAVRNSLFRIGPRNRRHSKRFVAAGEGPFFGLRDVRPTEGEARSQRDGLRVTVAELLRGLDDRDRTIVMARFGMDDATGAAVSREPKRFREIAEDLNISTERVRQLLGRALNHLRESAGTDPLAEF